jgi:hypothetical protein
VRSRISRGLTERPVAAGDENRFLNRELIPIVREMLRALVKAPVPFQWSAGAATADLAAGRDFAASVVLTQNSTLTLSNGYEGAEGTIFVEQDAVGGWTMTVMADGRSTLREDPFTDDNPAAGPGEITRYHYTFVTIAGTPYVVLERSYLL